MFVLLLQDKVNGDTYFDKRGRGTNGCVAGYWPDGTHLFNTEEEAINYAKNLLSSAEWPREDIKLKDFKAIKLLCLDWEFDFEYCTKEYLNLHPGMRSRLVDLNYD